MGVDDSTFREDGKPDTRGEVIRDLLRGRQAGTEDCIWWGSIVCPWPHVAVRCRCQEALGQASAAKAQAKAQRAGSAK